MTTQRPFTFHWRVPKVVAYRAAPPRRWRINLNRYPGVIIGAEIQLGSRILGLLWGRPGGYR